ncbi:MAG: pentapeptide repeat-containing protein [Usitatibacter sp.]
MDEDLLFRLLSRADDFNRANWSESIEFDNRDFSSATPKLTQLARLVVQCPVRFSRCTFPVGFSCEQTDFRQHVTFEGCTFAGSTSFIGTQFRDGASFDLSTFCDLADFTNCHVQRTLTARRAIFRRGANVVPQWHGNWNFQASRFADDLRFGGSVKGLSLENAVFHATVNLSGLTADNVFLRCARIRGPLHMSSLNCSGAVSLTAAWLGGGLIGTGVVARGTFGAEEAKVHGEMDLSSSGESAFPRSSFRGARILGKLDLSNRDFSEAASFEECYLGKAPSFHTCKLHQDTSFDDAEFPDIASQDAERCYRTLKLAMSSHQAYREELLFFALEMKSRAIQEPNPAVKVLYWLYENTSDFGRSVKRPLIWLAGLIVASAVVYALIFELPIVIDCADSPGCKLAFKSDRLAAIVSLSLHESLPFIGLLKEGASKSTDLLVGVGSGIPIAAQLWAIAQGVASVFLVFLVALGLRNLFRLK